MRRLRSLYYFSQTNWEQRNFTNRLGSSCKMLEIRLYVYIYRKSDPSSHTDVCGARCRVLRRRQAKSATKLVAEQKSSIMNSKKISSS